MLSTEVQTANPHDIYAIGVVSEELGTVGHVPKKISRLSLIPDQKWCSQIAGSEQEETVSSPSRRSRCTVYVHLYRQKAIGLETTKNSYRHKALT